MNFAVIGTDHRMQSRELGLEALLRAWLCKQFVEPLVAIAEEYEEGMGSSTCQRLAQERALHWYNLDMTSEEKFKAGILAEQRSRPISTEATAFRLASDEVREGAWAEKLSSPEPGTTLVVCGYLHFDSLVKKLQARGYPVDQRVYLETVPEIRSLNISAS